MRLYVTIITYKRACATIMRNDADAAYTID
jgi:hypothetical protein